MLLLSKRYSKKYRNNKRAFINLIKINAKQFDKLEFGGEINELYQTMIFYTADRLAEVDNKNYIQLRNNVLV